MHYILRNGKHQAGTADQSEFEKKTDNFRCQCQVLLGAVSENISHGSDMIWSCPDGSGFAKALSRLILLNWLVVHNLCAAQNQPAILHALLHAGVISSGLVTFENAWPLLCDNL